ncbi:MAG: SRPBCC family protein [Longimicrobiales bacterium]|nr:SRPBCC family protein [Longimicrobiales bacterium]
MNASADRVWSALRDFHDASWSEDVVEELTPVGSVQGTEPGAKRILNGAFHETLISLDDDEREFTYSIDDGPGPVAKEKVDGYVGRVRVLPVTVPGDANRCLVVWESRWAREEGGVAEFCDPIYRALLADLSAHFG